MRFAIGSTNPTKTNALIAVLSEYEEYRDCAVHSFAVQSGVSEQPKSLEEIIVGARNRAREAYTANGIAVGLESGLFPVPLAKSGMMVTTACVLYDGHAFHLGLSSAFECPSKVVDMVHEDGVDLNKAFHECGLTDDPKLGHRGGAIGVLTKGHVTRSEYMMQAIRLALIHLQNPELY
ncbi:MAG TPA: inosine/xanthosine triphosphatase [Candidatus Paceibacterota bacterium]|nr:inosine/xanthosine triphosphatase [Candidatus Paceibacterota bacterium]